MNRNLGEIGHFLCLKQLFLTRDKKEWTIRYSAQFKDGYDFFMSIVRIHSNKECLVLK